jgi:DCN1-like protein 3
MINQWLNQVDLNSFYFYIRIYNRILLAKESQLADNAINKLFEEYKDDYEDAILSDGIEKLCTDLNYSPDEFPILVLAFCLEATQMCKFTRQEFIHGLKNLNATTITELRLRLVQIVEKLETDVDLFKQLYRFTFNFGLDEGSRILGLDMAMDLWKLVFTVHKPANDLLDRWLNFLSKESIRGIQRDTWLMFQNFAECFDISSYDSDEAW